MRTLYQHAARRGADTRRYVAAVTAAGAEVRTLDEFFNRLLVFDRRVAVIPGHEGTDSAMVISDKSTVGLPRRHVRASLGTCPALHQQRDVADAGHRGGAAGDDHPDAARGAGRPGGAKRLGVSPRTYAAYVADLKSEFEVETRFQLGYEMGKRGISGREADSPLPDVLGRKG